MRISHIAVYVADLEGSRLFYEKYFGGRSGAMYHNLKTGLKTYFMSFDSDMRLELMARPKLSQHVGNCFGYAHIAFGVGSKAAVDELTERLRLDGYPIVSEPRTTGDRYYESVVADMDGNYIEITE